jgi:protocatechuate 3,4-dioxygenase beta subunit
MGRVLDPKGTPVKGARIEIWQANAAGRYAHVADTSPAPLDPNFEGFAVVQTDSEGRYRFKTIKPAAYPIGAGGPMRPPHIHFDVLGKYSRAMRRTASSGKRATSGISWFARFCRRQRMRNRRRSLPFGMSC